MHPMDTLRTPAALATLIAANIAPLVGIVAFGWSPSSLLILYLIDTLLALGGVVLLVMAHVTGNERGRPLSGWKDWAKALCGLTLLGAIFAFPLALPIVMVIGDDLAVTALARDRGFVTAIFVQLAMSAVAIVRQHAQLNERHDDDRVLARRLFYLVARWVVMFIAVVTGAITLLGATIGGFLMVAVYAGASVYFELFPERAERMLRGSNAKPIVWEGDLDGRESRTGKTASARVAAKGKR
jgi:hypothetical protein